MLRPAGHPAPAVDNTVIALLALSVVLAFAAFQAGCGPSVVYPPMPVVGPPASAADGDTNVNVNGDGNHVGDGDHNVETPATPTPSPTPPTAQRR